MSFLRRISSFHEKQFLAIKRNIFEGKRYGGLIQEEMEQFQDILSNDLHEYYINNKMPKYLLRIKQLMRVKEMFLRNLNIRMEKYKIAGVFNVFNRPISNLEFFTVPI